MLSTISTDSSLLRRLQANDTVAWSHFVRIYGPLIYSWSRRHGLASHDAADVTQDSLSSVVRSLGSFKHHGGQGSLRGWLWSITRNKVADSLRRNSPGGKGTGGSDAHNKLAQLPAPDVSASELPSATGDLQGIVRRGLESVQRDVEPRTWQAFALVVLDGRDTASVAAELGMTANHVRQAKSRVLKRLRELLSDDFG